MLLLYSLSEYKNILYNCDNIKIIFMKKQKFLNIYDLLDSKPKNISQLLGEFGEYVYRSYCRKKFFNVNH